MDMAQRLGYDPNTAGKALAARKHKPVISVVLSSEGNAFFDEVIRGMKEAAASYQIYGLEVNYYKMRGYSITRQRSILEEIRHKSNAVIINPIDAPEIAEMLDDFMNNGIFVVAVNNDISSKNRHCYVGSDYFNGGETACAMIAAILGENAKAGIVLGSRNIMGHRKRLEGFQHRMTRQSGFEIMDIIENEDDDIYSYGRTKRMLEDERPLVIAFDSVPGTVEMMKQGVIKAILYQHPYRQGHLSVDLAFEYLVNDRKPERSEYILTNEIRILENLK